MKTAADAAGKREEIRGAKEVKNQMIYRRALKLAIPMMIQNGITNMVGLIDNVMVGSIGTEAMTDLRDLYYSRTFTLFAGGREFDWSLSSR